MTQAYFALSHFSQVVHGGRAPNFRDRHTEISNAHSSVFMLIIKWLHVWQRGSLGVGDAPDHL